MLKSQVIAEIAVYTLATWQCIGVAALCFDRQRRSISPNLPVVSDSPLHDASLRVASSSLCSPRSRPSHLHAPHSLFLLPSCLFACSLSRQKLWKKHFGQIELTTSGKAMEIVARMLLFLVLVCLLLIALSSFLAWDAALVRQNYVGLKE